MHHKEKNYTENIINAMKVIFENALCSAKKQTTSKKNMEKQSNT